MIIVNITIFYEYNLQTSNNIRIFYIISHKNILLFYHSITSYNYIMKL